MPRRLSTLRPSLSHLPALRKRLLLHLSKSAKWLAATVLGAIVAFGVTAILSDVLLQGSEPEGASEDDAKEIHEARGVELLREEQSEPGFGPPREVFRCAAPTACEGPRYVTFNSYFNNPVVGDERPFLAVSELPGAAVVDSVDLDRRPTQLTLRAFIDNNTYRRVAGLATTDALGTTLRLALPPRPVYEAHPTAYLEARNAKPKTIWDTVTVRSFQRPVLLSYVAGSTALTAKTNSGRIVTRKLEDGLGKPAGLDLGRWKADFRYSGYVTFRVKADPAAEPVRDPNLTRGVGGSVVYLPAKEEGPAEEPVHDGAVGDRFTCSETSCNGPPFPKLNGYLNHPLLGDEADFVRAAYASDRANEGVERYRTVALVQPGDQLKVRIAIDNSADPESIGAPSVTALTARDVRVRVLLPASTGRELRVVSFLESSNTRPRTIADSLPIRSQRPIRLVFRPETAGILGHTLRPAARKLVRVGDLPQDPRWGIGVGAIPPSFSKVTYVEFYLRVVGSRG